jgi:hypothetical protein
LTGLCDMTCLGKDRAELWLGGVKVYEGGVCTPMSKPNRKLIGTSGKGLKGEILFNIRSHVSGTKGVLMGNKSCNDVA